MLQNIYDKLVEKCSEEFDILLTEEWQLDIIKISNKPKSLEQQTTYNPNVFFDDYYNALYFEISLKNYLLFTTIVVKSKKNRKKELCRTQNILDDPKEDKYYCVNTGEPAYEKYVFFSDTFDVDAFIKELKIYMKETTWQIINGVTNKTQFFAANAHVCDICRKKLCA